MDFQKIKANSEQDKLMMSESLYEHVDEPPQFEEPTFVVVIGHRQVKDKQMPLLGSLRSVLFDVEPEVEFRVIIDEAFSVINSTDQFFAAFEFHYGDKHIIKVPGPLIVKAARISDVEPKDGMCILSLQLKRLEKQ